jgi:hypothetical protein
MWSLVNIILKSSLCLTKYQTMNMDPAINQAPSHEDLWRSASRALRILNLGTRGDEWSASLFGRFIPGETAPEFPLDRRLAGFQNLSGRNGEGKE